jgi:hypothetical protein
MAACQEVSSIKFQKQLVEQQLYESTKKAESLESRNNILTTEYKALQTGHEKGLLEIKRATERIRLMEDREKQLAALVKQLYEEQQSIASQALMHKAEQERMMAQKDALCFSAVAEKNQMNQKLVQMGEFLNMTHQQLRSVQQQQLLSMASADSPDRKYSTMPSMFGSPFGLYGSASSSGRLESLRSGKRTHMCARVYARACSRGDGGGAEVGLPIS